MEILKPTEDSIAQALSVLQEGGVVAHATETCYGLACDLTNRDAVKRLFTIKQRPPTAPVSALFANIETTKAYVVWSPDAEILAHEHLPGPMTIILPLLDGTKLFPTPNGGATLGIRISPHPIAMQLTAFAYPLSTTSANLHGQQNPYSAEEIVVQFSNQSDQPDILLDSGALKKNDVSTVLDFTSGEMQILRGGDSKVFN